MKSRGATMKPWCTKGHGHVTSSARSYPSTVTRHSAGCTASIIIIIISSSSITIIIITTISSAIILLIITSIIPTLD